MKKRGRREEQRERFEVQFKQTGEIQSCAPRSFRFERLQNIGPNAVGDSLCCRVDRVMYQVGVARRRLDAAVTEQLADRQQGLAERERTGGKAVPQVVQPNVIESGTQGSSSAKAR